MREVLDIDFVRSRGRGLALAAAGLLIVGAGLGVVSYLLYRAEQRDLDAAAHAVPQRLAASQAFN